MLYVLNQVDACISLSNSFAVAQKYSQTYTSPKTIHSECHKEKGRPFPTQCIIKWWNALPLPYGNQKFKGIQKEIWVVNRKQVSAVALEHNFAYTACSLPCVTAAARPLMDHTVLVLVLFSGASAVGHGWGRTGDGSYDLRPLPWELWVQQAFLQLPLEQSYDTLGRDRQGV